MKEEIYTDIICKSFCSYFKQGKEDMNCGGYRVLINNFTIAELRKLADLPDNKDEIKRWIPPDDETLFSLVCSKCDFAIDGCDYKENRSGPPCGGYILIERLVKMLEPTARRTKKLGHT